MRYFVRFSRHHPSVRYMVIPTPEQAYCFASADDAWGVANVLRRAGADATVVTLTVKPPPPPPPPPPRTWFAAPTPPTQLEAWVDKILEVGGALGKEGRDRIDAGY